MPLIDLSAIHFRKTRDYMREVLSSYDNGNYRSAVVMLYSVCLCDLLFKLIELRDVYSDQFSRDLLRKIDEKIALDKASPAWEAELVDSLYKNSPILDSQSYATICHLRDLRNLSAHPVMDDYSELFMPSKEIVEAYIKSAFETVLAKPALLVSNVVEVISEDLDEKRGYLLDNKEDFEKYVRSKYLIRMPAAMLCRVFKSFWKFTFILQNEKCDRNRLLNVHFLQAIYRFNKDVIEAELAAEVDKFEVAEREDILTMAFWLCGYEPAIYAKLPAVTRALLSKYATHDPFYRLISWFMAENKEAHVNTLISSGFHDYPTEELRIKYVFRRFKETNDLQHLYRYFISIIGHASSFKGAESKIDTYIIPYIKDMSPENLERVIAVFNENSQVYYNYYLSYYCGKVWEYAKKFLTADYVKEHYPRFIIPVDNPMSAV